jgi:hypothetical protein
MAKCSYLAGSERIKIEYKRRNTLFLPEKQLVASQVTQEK